MSNFFYKGVNFSELISTQNAADTSFKDANINISGTNYRIKDSYVGFPTIANAVINNRFDLSLNLPNEYLIKNQNIGSVLPAYTKIYKSTLSLNVLTVSTTINTARSFNTDAIFPITIPSVVNKMGFILSGGGGGGGTSNRHPSNGFGGGAGGGGGFCYGVLDLNSPTIGRTCTLTIGRGGNFGVTTDGNNLGMTSFINGADGKETTLAMGPTIIATALGGGGGYNSSNPVSGSFGGSGGESNINATINNGLVSGSAVAATSVNKGEDGGKASSGNGASSRGGKGVYNNVITNMPTCWYLPNTNTQYFVTNNNIVQTSNNTGSIPAGGDLTNFTRTSNSITYNLNSPTNPLLNTYSVGGGGASQNNGSGWAHPGAPGAPGFAIIYYYL